MAINDPFPSIDPGEFRHRFTLLEQTIGDDFSGSAVTYAPGKSPIVAWAKMEFLRGAEMIKAGQDVTQVYLKLTMWYRREFTAKSQIQAPDGARYIIQAIENVKGMNTYQVLTCLGIGENAA